MPINNDFWSRHRPGDRWNCKCGLEQTDKNPNTPPPEQTLTKHNKPHSGLENNPAFDGKIFSDNHPYIAHHYPGAAAAVERFIEKEKISPILDSIRKNAIKQDKKATVVAIKALKKKMPEHSGIVFEGKGFSFVSGKMTLLRRSFDDVLEHAVEDGNVRQWLKTFDKSKMKNWKYAGWAKNRPYSPDHPKFNPNNPNAPQHGDTKYFNYYKVKIEGKTYWANVKVHKVYGEVLYTIEKEKPADLIKGHKKK